MATAYKTPGVYIEEIPKFPPSIAPVETAIPAFIGYTKKADQLVANDLRLKPKRISSMVEYEKYFGVAQPETAIAVTVMVTQVGGVTTDQKAVASLAETARSKHVMYYALQMFFANCGHENRKADITGNMLDASERDGFQVSFLKTPFDF